jgi:hypothetical protein
MQKKHNSFLIISKYVKDRDFLEMAKRIIFDNFDRTGSKVGIPIGNYTSQFFGNIYLNELDHFVKEKLKIKYYVRYMDDFIFLLQDKNECVKTRKIVEEYLKEKLELELNNKTNYFKVKQGVLFCGYKIYHNKILMNKKYIRKIYKGIKILNEVCLQEDFNYRSTNAKINSWLAHMSHANTQKLRKKIINRCNWIYHVGADSYIRPEGGNI